MKRSKIINQLFVISIIVIMTSIPTIVSADDAPYIQYLPEYMPQAPNAQAVARAIDIPVNTYTGIPNISIPLYTVQVGSLSVPITLSYQGGGIRPNQEATSVGLGWNLSAGGAITRTVKCADDFMEYNVSNCQYTVGYLGRSSWPILNLTQIDNNYYHSISYGNIGTEIYWTHYLYVDSEPDLFFYSLPGRGGKFSFKKDSSIVYFDKSANVKLTPSFGASPRPFFYAIDAMGTSYTFKTKERTQVFSGSDRTHVNSTGQGVDITAFGPNDHLNLVSDYTSTWFLDRMISSTNDTIDFEYASESFMLPLQENCRYQRRVQGASVHQEGDGPRYSRTKTWIDSKRLTKISWRGGHVDFIYNLARIDLIGESKALTDVKVYNDNNALVCHWKLSYGYFDTDMTDIPNNRKHLFKRLRLNSVKDMLSEQNPYNFTYYNEVPMPLKNTRNLDYWGYYNGVNQGENYYCPEHDGIIQSYKSANDHYSKIGVLEKIDHPTGGTTKLHWECNKTGESIIINNSVTMGNHDSYTKGFLKSTKDGEGNNDEKIKAVLLTERTEIYLLLSSSYSGNQTPPSYSGTPFIIERVNDTGNNVVCYSWNNVAVGDEIEQTVILDPGLYEFKCKAVVDDVEFGMFFIDSKNKYTVKKQHKNMVFCYNGTEITGIPTTDSKTFTLDHSGIVCLTSSSYVFDINLTSGFSNIFPFNISKRNSNGSYTDILNWTVSGFNLDETRTIHLDAGTYRIKCDALLESVAFTIAYSYGDTDYTPINIHDSGNGFTNAILAAYQDGVAGYVSDFSEIATDTLALESPAMVLMDLFFWKKDSAVNTQDFINTRPVSIYKKNILGSYEKIFSIPASCFGDFEEIRNEIVGLYLGTGNYLFKCEATVEDVVFGSELAYKTDCIYSNNGAKRGGLRIGRVEGEKDITYLYEDGKDIIRPCTLYKEEEVYDDDGQYKTVVYQVQSSESVRPLSTLKNGNVIGYSKVVELFTDNSRIEYKYHNEEEELQDEDFPYSPSITDWKNGLLQSKIHFDAQGDTLSVTTNTYQLTTTENSYIAGFVEVRPGYNKYYSCYVLCPMLTHSNNTEYRNNGKYSVKQILSYNENFLCKEQTTQIGQDIQKTIIKYPTDFNDNLSQLMVSTHQFGIPVAQLSMRNGVFVDGTRKIFGNFNELTDNRNTVICGNRSWDDTKFNEMYLPTHLLTLNTSNSATDFASCQFDTTCVYNSYTKYGNVRELAYKDMPISYLWSYKGMLPIAEIRNATYQQFMSRYATMGPDMSNVIYQDPEFIRDKIWNTTGLLSNASVNVALYKPLVGTTEITDNSGFMKSFNYDAAGRLTMVYLQDILGGIYETSETHTYGKNVVTSEHFSTTDIHNGIKYIQYYDAWGRTSLCASQGTQQNGKYSYGLQTYDFLGRPSRSYIPVPSESTTGSIMDQTGFLQLSATAFSGDGYSFSLTSYDALGRTEKVTTPGNEWFVNNKAATTQYLTNTAGEVKKYGVSGNSLTNQGYYAAGSLDCTVTTDPDGQTIRSYKDVFGNVVLERRAGNYDTYYVYDNLNRLRFVLPPKYQEEPNLSYYAYQYEYDGRGRVSKKTLPGCSPIRYWYDSSDRLVKMQDGLLSQSASYRVWTYDGLGRVLSQGIEHPGGLNYNEMLYFYDNYNYTSNYSSMLSSDISNLLPPALSPSRGLLTGTWQLASNGESLLTVLGYDQLGHLNKRTETGLGRKVSVSDYINNLDGMVITESFRKYRPNASNTGMECIVSGTVENNFDYLHTNLLTSSVITIYDKNQNMRTDTIQNLTYDAFGHVMRNDRGGTVADMTYGYDQMHGWLKSIKSGGRFEQKLFRETEGNTPCYNGNISAMTWRTGNDYVRRFDYEYNGMNWLTDAAFSYYSIGNPSSPSPTLTLIPYVGVDNEDYTCQYYYDKNGNLTGAYRQGLTDVFDEEPFHDYDTMDDYNVEYYGNQKRSVNYEGEGSPYYYGSSSFVDGLEDGDNEYAYNANGAMTMDLNKGITDISYDLLNNIREITFSNNRSIRYVYAADGTRLRTVHSKRVGNSYVKDSTDYVGNLVMKNGQPGMYQFAGGYLSFANSLLSGCHYYIQDYQGSNRMVVNKTGTVEQITHYYPYGGIIGGIDSSPNLQQYKFEGKELDRTYGLDWYDIHARQYDPVVPSWHAIDPLCEKYYGISPYAYCANNPVNYVDPNGRLIVFSKGVSDTFKNNFAKAVKYLNANGCGGMLKALNDSKKTYYISESTNGVNYFDYKSKTISWNSQMGLKTNEDKYLSPTTLLNHEVDHALEYDQNPGKYLINLKPYDDYHPDNLYNTPEEKRVIMGSEQKTARALGETKNDEFTRTDHSGRHVLMESTTSNKPIKKEEEFIIYSTKKNRDE